MNVIKQINFKELRDKGANAIEIKDDEVIQMSSKKGMMCIVTQDFLLDLIKFKNENSFSLNMNEPKNHLMGFVNQNLNIQGSAVPLRNNTFGSKNSKNIGELLKNLAPKNLEERVSELEHKVDQLLLNKEENNGKD